MIKNYIKIAWRNLIQNKTHTIINIAGLSLGMAAAILISLWIQNEVSYDQFHQKKDRIYRVWNNRPVDSDIQSWNTVSEPVARAIEKDIPEVERAVRTTQGNTVMFSVGESRIRKFGIAVDTGFLQIFSFPLTKGSPHTALNDPHSVILTENTAESLFGKEDPMGKIVRLNNNENLTVTGILKDLPNNTDFEFEYLQPFTFFEAKREGLDLGWDDNSTPTYVLLKPNTTLAAVEPKIKLLRQNYVAEAKSMKWELFLYPIDRWRLYSSFSNGLEDNGGRSGLVDLLSIISAFILLIACINFMNLSTARSEKRAKEVGIRKVVGAQRGSLIFQFIGESIFIAFLAGVIAIVIVQLSLPGYNQLTYKNLFFNFGSSHTWLLLIVFILFTGLLAGIYPAFFLSSFRPVAVLKGTFKKVDALVTPRKALVVLQFTFAIILIIGTVVVKQQTDFARNREPGYNRNNLIYHSLNGDIQKNYSLIKTDLLASGVAKSITKSNAPLTERRSDGWGQRWEGKDPNDKTSFDRYMADEGLGTTAGLQFVQGRDFDLKQFPTDSTGLIINESALKIMKFKDPIGKIVGDLGVKWHIVGVIKNFILTSPYEPTRPLLICGAKSSFMNFNFMHIKLNGENSVEDNLKAAAVIFKKHNPEYPFEYNFIDEAYSRKFEDEERLGTLAALFAGLTIFISCMGLFGLVTYVTESRIKEIGVRKILGASVMRITILLSKDFLVLVMISFIIAAPFAYWAMTYWLKNFSYRIDISWWVFASAGLLSTLIALTTVSYQAFKASLANPAKSLRSE